MLSDRPKAKRRLILSLVLAGVAVPVLAQESLLPPVFNEAVPEPEQPKEESEQPDSSAREAARTETRAPSGTGAVVESDTLTEEELAEIPQPPPPVELPPAIQASRTYRCKDNALVYIDFYTNNTAMVRKTKGGEPAEATLTAETPGGAYKAEGYSVSGNSDQITYSAPGKGSQSCKA